MYQQSLSKFGVPLPTGGCTVMSQPKLKNKFRVVTYGFGADVSWGNSGAWLCIATNTCTRPNLVVDTHEMHKFDTVSRYTGKYRWGEITLTVKDTVDNKAATAIHSHIQKQKDYYRRLAPRMTGYGYKFEMLIQTMKGDVSIDDQIMVAGELIDKYILGNEDNISPKLLSGTFESWLCTGCIVTDYHFGSYDYSTANFNEITLTIIPDNCVLIDEGGHVMLESSASGGFSLGGYFGGLLDMADSKIGSMLGLSGPVSSTMKSAVKSGVNSAFESVKGWF